MKRKVKSRAPLKNFLPVSLLALTILPFAGCHNYLSAAQAQEAQQNDPNYDPASANMAPVTGDPNAQADPYAQAARQPYPNQQQTAPRSSSVQNESIQSAQQAQQQGAPAPQNNQPQYQDENQPPPQYQDQQQIIIFQTERTANVISYKIK